MKKNQHEQKRLVLCNLHELYVAFKEQNLDVKDGFSKFCSQRPKSCVIAEKSGTYLVCVCTIYQNAVLLGHALDLDVTYKDLISKIVCDATDRECMMHRCENIQNIFKGRTN